MVVRVELWSAVSGERTELARMRISNDGRTTVEDPSLGTYRGETLRGRSETALDRGEVTRSGRVERFPRQKLHVWFLVARMLLAMGYGSAPASISLIFRGWDHEARRSFRPRDRSRSSEVPRLARQVRLRPVRRRRRRRAPWPERGRGRGQVPASRMEGRARVAPRLPGLPRATATAAASARSTQARDCRHERHRRPDFRRGPSPSPRR